MTTNIFNPRRFWLLLYELISLRWTGWMQGILAIAAFTALYTIFANFVWGNIARSIFFFEIIFSILLFTCGAVSQSSSFVRTKNINTAPFWFTLPGSTLEKLLVHLVINPLGFMVMMVLIFMLTVNLINFILASFFSFNFEFFSLFTMKTLKILAVFSILNLSVFTGTLFFKKRVLVKTFLFFFLLMLSLEFFFGLGFRIMFAEHFDGIMLNMEAMEWLMELSGSGDLALHGGKIGRAASLVIKILFWGVFGPYCLLLSYFRLKETEV